MNRWPQRLPYLALLLAAGLLVGAKAPQPSKFIPATAVDVTTLLPPPVPADSAEGKAELAAVLRAQHDATEAAKARAVSESKLTMAAFTSVVGPWFTKDNLPQTAALLKQLESDSKIFTNAGKDYFKRPRPYEAGGDVVDLTGEYEKEFGYPSGHSTRGTLYAAVLANLMPELKDKLMARSQEIGWDRIIAGVHYPSDVTAGRVLGQALAKAALANQEFQAELDKVRQEIAAAKEKAAQVPAAVH